MNDQALLPKRVGILLDSDEVPGWIHHVLGQLLRCTTLTPLFLLLPERRKRKAVIRAPILFRCWRAADRRLRWSRMDAVARRPWRELPGAGQVPIVRLSSGTAGPVIPRDLRSLKAADLDLIVQFSDERIATCVAACAHEGVWRIRNAHCGEDGDVPVQFWDMYSGNRVATYGPEIIEQKRDTNRVLYRCAAITTMLSLALNQNATCWELAHVLLELLTNPKAQAVESPRGWKMEEEDSSLPHPFDNVHMIRFMGRWIAGVMRHEVEKRLFREHWSILLEPKTATGEQAEPVCTVLHPPPDHFYADPFVVDKDECTHLFFEDYDFDSGKGVISACEIDASGRCGKPEVVLERDYHLSYPFLFTWEGEQYMIPETRDNGTIELYRAAEFPQSWVHEAVLMSGVAAADSTLLQYEGKWWLFTAGLHPYALHNQRLYLFFADSPLGPWQAHPQNPIVSDARHSRPAGNLYIENGQLIRPGQDSSKAYGYAVQLHRVDTLTETEYEETLIASITPHLIRGSKGIHTSNQSERFRVVDCKFLTFRFGANLFSPRRKTQPCCPHLFPRASAVASR